MASLTRPYTFSNLSSFAPACSPSLHFQLPASLSSHHVTCVAMATSASSLEDLLLSTTRSDPVVDDTFGSSIFGSLSDVISPPPGLKPAIECPQGFFRYETMAVLRPDISEEQRIQLTQRYEEAIIAGGGMGLETFNRGLMPLAYNIRKKDMRGVNNRYLDGVFFLFTYCLKPDSVASLEAKFKTDDDIIRSSTLKVKPPRRSL